MKCICSASNLVIRLKYKTEYYLISVRDCHIWEWEYYLQLCFCIMQQIALLTSSCSNMSACASLLFCAGQNSPHRLKKRLTQLFDEAVWHQPSVLLLEKLDHAMPHVADAQEAAVDVDGSNGVKRAQGSLLVISTDSQDRLILFLIQATVCCISSFSSPPTCFFGTRFTAHYCIFYRSHALYGSLLLLSVLQTS